jgi:hypothetical protein
MRSPEKLLARESCAQSERPIGIYPHVGERESGHRANGLTQQNAFDVVDKS